MRRFALLAGLAALWLGIAPARAQYTPDTPFLPAAQATLGVSNASGNVALGNAGPTVIVWNSGTVTAYIAFGLTNAVTVTTGNGTPIPAGSCYGFRFDKNTYLAAITAASTTTLNLTIGSGNPFCSLAGAATTVNVVVSGFDSGPIQITSSTLNAGSYSAGMSLGGLLTVPIARTNGGSGGLSLIGYKSTAGSVGQIVVRVWQKNPANSTCTDHTAFVGSATDDVQLIVAPFALTPAAPAVTTGDASTYATIQPGRLSWVNSDTSPSKNLYVCVLTVATDTVDESSTVAVRLSGDLN